MGGGFDPGVKRNLVTVSSKRKMTLKTLDELFVPEQKILTVGGENWRR